MKVAPSALPAADASIDTSRRTLLTAMCGLAAMAALPTDWTMRLLTTDGLEVVLQRIRATPGAIAIANAYLARASGPATVAELHAALTRDLGIDGEHLGKKIASDFVDGHILMQDGWPISETEARLCALAQLSKA